VVLPHCLDSSTSITFGHIASNFYLHLSPPSVRPQPPAHDPPPWTHPHLRVPRPRLRPRAPFEPRALLAHLSSLICALCPTLSPSLSLCPLVQGAPPPPAVDRCLFCGHRRVRAPSSAMVSFASLSAAWDTLQCALIGAIFAQPESRRHHPVEPLRLRHCFTTPALPLKVSKLPVPLIRSFPLCLARDCSPELLRAAVSLPRRVQRPLVPPHRREGHGRVRQTAQIAPRLVPEPLMPRRGWPSCLRRVLAAGPSGATAPMPVPSR
jgi:hypothetical protein